MKYVMVIIVTALIVAGFVGYFYFQAQQIPQTNATVMAQPSENGQIAELRAGINRLQEIITQQSLFIQQLKEDNLNYSAQITRLENKFEATVAKLQQILSDYPALATAPSLIAPSASRQPLADPSFQAFSPELFQNPEFSKLFEDQVQQSIKNIEQKQQEEQAAQMATRSQERITQRVAEFAKAQNLNESQQQELNRLLLERSARTTEIFTQMQAQGANRDAIRTQQTAITNETNEKIKAVLLPQQYEEYLKTLAMQSRGGMMGGGNNRNRQQPRQPPSTPAPQ